jgi:hypothetical protein
LIRLFFRKVRTGVAPLTKNRISHLFAVAAIAPTLSFVAPQPAQAQAEPAYTFSVLHSFKGTDGANPAGTLHLDTAGNLYSTTPYGGDVGCIDTGGLAGCGLVFKLNEQGKETVLYKFTGNADGGNPNVGLVRDKEGNFYGATLLAASTASEACSSWIRVTKKPCCTASLGVRMDQLLTRT